MICYTLLSDGVSDQALMPIITRVLEEQMPHVTIEPQWANLQRLPKPPKTLPQRILAALQLYPCDLLFVHRDAEREPLIKRDKEIEEAVEALTEPLEARWIAVIPVRMQEAWLLVEEAAIRRAAGNPRGTMPLLLPPLRNLENLPDPKLTLNEALTTASGLGRNRRSHFNPASCSRWVGEYLHTLVPLRTLPAFQTFEHRLMEVLLNLRTS